MNFIVFLAVGFTGGYIGHKLKLPVGAMLGAMFAVAIVKSLGFITFQSGTGLIFFLQVCLGAMLGVTFLNFKKEYVKKVSLALFFILFGLVVMIFFIVLLLALVTDLSLPITILSSSPGAIYEMAMLAKMLEEDAPAVVFLHLARVVIIMTLFPLVLHFIIRFLAKRKRNEKAS
ncbi:AbrB family transcriptional regulator [Anaerobacillus sp. MEB173]|uniref:AbrB family transcriptional regulator n=1 Tax=Anaerobacillus sp. MEB173 TaxID=3383345 RepID=UPI003F8DA1CD